MPTFIRVNDHGLSHKIDLLTKRELVAAERAGITEAVKLARSIARSAAPEESGEGKKGISYKTRTRSGVVEGRAYNKVYYMRFQARGTGGRRTRRGAYRGVLPSIPFMQYAAYRIDPVAPKFVEKQIAVALRKAGLG
jgi:hypothetical protein